MPIISQSTNVILVGHPNAIVAGLMEVSWYVISPLCSVICFCDGLVVARFMLRRLMRCLTACFPSSLLLPCGTGSTGPRTIVMLSAVRKSLLMLCYRAIETNCNVRPMIEAQPPTSGPHRSSLTKGCRPLSLRKCLTVCKTQIKLRMSHAPMALLLTQQMMRAMAQQRMICRNQRRKRRRLWQRLGLS